MCLSLSLFPFLFSLFCLYPASLCPFLFESRLSFSATKRVDEKMRASRRLRLAIAAVTL